MFFRKRAIKRACIRLAKKKDVVRDVDNLIEELSFSSGNVLSEAVYRHLFLITEINNLSVRLLTQIKEPVYLTSSLFLRQSFDLLNQKEVESLHFVTGPEIGGIKVLDYIVNFNLKEQSTVYAKADSSSLRKTLIWLSRHEYKILGYFHIHPGNGPRSILPSDTDLALDGLLNKGGYEAIGSIFSRDGFMRFFSSGKFRVNIYGKGVERINDKLYHFVEVS